MQAIILAGGKGTRLSPYTTVLPKPLVPVGEYPILEIIIRQLKACSIKDVIISTGHLAELIEAYFADGRRWGIKIRYIREEEPLGTAGAIKNINGLENDFIVMNGDILTNMNYKELYKFHIDHKGISTIAVTKREVTIDFGVIELSDESKLVNYIEKPKHFHYVSMGINVLNKRCKKYISAGESIGMPEFILRMKSNNEDIYCYKCDSYWLDIGRINDFQKAQEEFIRNKKKFLYG